VKFASVAGVLPCYVPRDVMRTMSDAAVRHVQLSLRTEAMQVPLQGAHSCSILWILSNETVYNWCFADVSRTITFPDKSFPGQVIL